MSEEIPIVAPPVPGTEAWYYTDGQQQIVPIQRDALGQLIASGKINGQTLVWKKGMPEWLPVSKSELVPLLPADAPPPVPTAITPSSTASSLTPIPEEKVYPSKPLRSSSWVWWNLLIPGIAQVVYGQAEKGILILLLSPFLVGLTAGFGILAIWPIAIIDAMKVHGVVNHRGWVGKWAWFPR